MRTHYSAWNLLASARKCAQPLGARLVMRTEKGFVHVGGDTDGTTLLGDIGMDRAVAKKKANFVGRRSLTRGRRRRRSDTTAQTALVAAHRPCKRPMPRSLAGVCQHIIIMTIHAPSYILTIRCCDAIGIVAAVSSALADSDAFISESSHFGDDVTGLFFMRSVFRVAGSNSTTIEDFRIALAPVTQRFSMEMNLCDARNRLKVMLAVSKHGHCLNHLLHRWHSDELPVEVVGIDSNHEDMRRLAEWHGLPFHYLPVQGDKPAQEARLLDRFESSGAELLVLARYMQVLSDDLCRSLEGRCINIHHSFLPSFKGTKPYHQAHGLGVKIVGATSHYVTADRDKGPILEQDTIRVDHAMDADSFLRLGKDLENILLARAVQWHAERRVLLNGHRTVVFRHGA